MSVLALYKLYYLFCFFILEIAQCDGRKVRNKISFFVFSSFTSRLRYIGKIYLCILKHPCYLLDKKLKDKRENG